MLFRSGKVSKYRILQLPEQQDVIQEFLNNLGEEAKTKMMREELGENYKYFEVVKQAKNMQGIQTRLITDFEIK